IAVSEWRISWDIEHVILPIVDILSASISWLGARRCGSFRRSRPTPLSNMRILSQSEIFVFRRCVLTVPLVIPFLVVRGKLPQTQSLVVKTAGETSFSRALHI